MLKFIVLTVILLNSQSRSALPPSDLKVVTLLPDSDYSCCSENEMKRGLPIVYCYYGTQRSLMNIWQTVSAFVEMTRPEKYELYEGTDESDVWAQYEMSRSKWGFSMFSWGRKSIELDPFNTSCLGIRSSKNYTLKTRVEQVNNMLVGMFTLGALLFFLAPFLVHNQIFYYIVGTTFGISVFLLVFLYFIIILLPLKRPAVLGMVAGGSTVIFYFFQSFVNQILALMPFYTKLVYGYLVVSGFISFIICYRFGPLTNPRSKNIIQWSLQIASLLLVFFSSYNRQVAAVFTVLIAILYKLPVTKWSMNAIRNNRVKAQNKAVMVHKKPTPAVRRVRKLSFLSQEEFRVQGIVETERGLEEIRCYLKASPQRWATARRRVSKQSLQKLAKFITGESHVTREELVAKQVEEMDSEQMEELLTDDEQ